MATTTNYNWSTPDDTSLVKDGAAAIRTLGSSIDTTTKALNPSTTLGDIEYRSATANTNTRLGIGSAGQVLSVSSGVPAWVTPTSSSALTLISRSSFSNVANTGTTFDTIFSATYKNYLVVIEAISASTAANDLHVQFRNGSSTLASDYYGAQFGVQYGSTSLITNNTNNLAHIILTADMSAGTSLTFTASGVGGTTTTSGIQGTGIDRALPTAINYAGGYFGASVNIDGLIFKSSSSNITGTIAIYGLAIA
jgi:hypothetical protein